MWLQSLPSDNSYELKKKKFLLIQLKYDNNPRDNYFVSCQNKESIKISEKKVQLVHTYQICPKTQKVQSKV